MPRAQMQKVTETVKPTTARHQYHRRAIKHDTPLRKPWGVFSLKIAFLIAASADLFCTGA